MRRRVERDALHDQQEQERRRQGADDLRPRPLDPIVDPVRAVDAEKGDTDADHRDRDHHDVNRANYVALRRGDQGERRDYENATEQRRHSELQARLPRLFAGAHGVLLPPPSSKLSSIGRRSFHRCEAGCNTDTQTQNIGDKHFVLTMHFYRHTRISRDLAII